MLLLVIGFIWDSEQVIAIFPWRLKKSVSSKQYVKLNKTKKKEVKKTKMKKKRSKTILKKSIKKRKKERIKEN